VDHRERRREITDAVVRLTLKGGLTAATFREVAAEAGVSVRLVQYYFGTKDELLLATQRHVAHRSILRLRTWVAETDGAPRSWLRAFMGSFIPIDDESRVAMLMYVALHTESLVHPELARTEALEVPRTMQRTIAENLRRGRIAGNVDVDHEASILTALVPALGQNVLDGSMQPDQAFELIDYALARALPEQASSATRKDRRDGAPSRRV
jgi:AcrR family transcriptional regulator